MCTQPLLDSSNKFISKNAARDDEHTFNMFEQKSTSFGSNFRNNSLTTEQIHVFESGAKVTLTPAIKEAFAKGVNLG